MYLHQGGARQNAQSFKFNPPSLHTQLGLRKYLNTDERERFIRAAAVLDGPTRALCLTLLHSGCRLSEALNLTIANVQVSERVLLVRSLKKRGAMVVRQVPIPVELLNLLLALPSCSARVDDQCSMPLWNWHRTWAWMRIKHTMAIAGIVGPHATPRGLRHGFGVHAVQSGVPLNLVQKWLGHSHISTTAIYTDAVGPEERTIAERMW